MISLLELEQSLSALVSLYIEFDFELELQCIRQDNAWVSVYSSSIERAINAHRAIKKYPQLYEEICNDFFDEFMKHQEDIAEILDVRNQWRDYFKERKK